MVKNFKKGDKIEIIGLCHIMQGTIGYIRKYNKHLNTYCISFPSLKGKLHSGASLGPIAGCEDRSCYWIWSSYFKKILLNWKRRLQTCAVPTKEAHK